MSRIIAGSRRGQRLDTPAGERTRPTTDRVREAFFSALASWAGTADAPVERWFAGLRFADLYAGSGAVGLEAASRGADAVLLVEAERAVAAVTQANVRRLGLPARVQTAKVERLLAAPAPEPFDVVWLDPPYAVEAATLDVQLRAVVVGWLAPDGVVVVERGRRSPDPDWPEGMETWSRRYGETVLHWAQRQPADEQEEG
ncbi:16S rRNA (guanine(966)-N(2))-methyltransferase RsmD [Desertihabitans aurantiacus]|uniref:16S rRNA (guanine(966)-N(2))-methyltransferase RsmD n=1 Tax=Desertihabitans aurantiacus TaxID=2282477 RepID=UPI000DF7EF4B|nr:16S rRNA (guanine(966)-N(2))-methyltransferase RsmD [Desertihabitans aurantiacus]